MRSLDEQFMKDLKENGLLNKITTKVKTDLTLDFQIRDNQIHIYYRGGKILDIKKNDNYYIVFFDNKYCKENSGWELIIAENENIDFHKKIMLLPQKIENKNNINIWIEAIPLLKQLIDEYLAQHLKTEREYQQHIVNENNNLRTSNATDYFIVDIEYANKNARFDLIAILWESSGSKRKLLKGYKPKLAFIELKHGDKSLTDKAGLIKHLNDIESYLSTIDNYQKICKEMQNIFQQKRELNLIHGLNHNRNEILEFSLEKPQLIFLISGHNPKSQILKNEIEKINDINTCDIRFGSANFIGFSLYQESLFKISDFKNMFSRQIYSKG